MSNQIKITATFPNGSSVNKYITVEDELVKIAPEAIAHQAKLRSKEIVRDYLFSVYGKDWHLHDPFHGTFWK